MLVDAPTAVAQDDCSGRDGARGVLPGAETRRTAGVFSLRSSASNSSIAALFRSLELAVKNCKKPAYPSNGR